MMKHLQRGSKHLQTGVAALAILALAGCGPKPRLEFPTPPAGKTACAPDPDLPPPGPEGRVTDADNARYLQSLHGAWRDCSDTVAWWRDWSAALARAAARERVK